jgi:hypothetical protein
LVGAIVIQALQPWAKKHEYVVTDKTDKLIGKRIPQYAQKLSLNPNTQTYVYNEGYRSSPGESAGQSSAPKFTAQFETTNSKKVTVTDPATDAVVTFKPLYGLDTPQQDSNRLIYPFVGMPAKNIYSVKGTGIKEDIVVSSFVKDELTFDYELGLGDAAVARIETDGSLSVYGTGGVLQGSVATGSQQDADLLQKARQNAKKDTLLFRLPAPFIKEYGKKNSLTRAYFKLEGNKLTLHASGLKNANYPLTIDPTIYIVYSTYL